MGKGFEIINESKKKKLELQAVKSGVQASQRKLPP